MRVHAGSLTTKIPSNPASNLARAVAHQRRQERHALDCSLLAAMASAGDESPGGDGTTNGDGLRAPLETGAREPTPWGNRTIGRDGLRAPLETGVREPTPWSDRIEPGANDPRTWRDRATHGCGLRARPEPGETDPRTWRDRATGNDLSRGSTEKSNGFRWALEIAIWCLDLILDALQHIERRTRRERMVQSPV